MEESAKPFLEDPDTGEEVTGLKTRNKQSYTIMYHLGTIICTSLVWWLFIHILHLNQLHLESLKPPTRRTLSCGNSTIEARAMNCVYDELLAYWIPLPCYDRSTAEDYKKAMGDQWLGYHDQAGTQLLDMEAMSEHTSQDYPFYTSAREHIYHCVFTQRRAHLHYIAGGLYLADMEANYHHTLHCAMAIIKGVEFEREVLDSLMTKTVVGFASCEVNI